MVAGSAGSRSFSMVSGVGLIVGRRPVVVCCVNQSPLLGDNSQTPKAMRKSDSSYCGDAQTLMSSWIAAGASRRSVRKPGIFKELS